MSTPKDGSMLRIVVARLILKFAQKKNANT